VQYLLLSVNVVSKHGCALAVRTCDEYCTLCRYNSALAARTVHCVAITAVLNLSVLAADVEYSFFLQHT
jgi:hypothetical protein